MVLLYQAEEYVVADLLLRSRPLRTASFFTLLPCQIYCQLSHNQEYYSSVHWSPHHPPYHYIITAK